MKKIIKPAEKEESLYFSDFSGKPFRENEYPDVNIKIEFNYGSKYDGAALELHLTDEECLGILEHIKANLSEDVKQTIKKRLDYFEKNHDDSMQMRDWDNCDRNSNNIWLLRNILGIKENENN